MKIGDVLKKEDGLHVITETVNKNVSKTEKLEDYVSRNIRIQEGSEWKTIKEVIEKRCDMYLSSGIETFEHYKQ